MSQRKPPTSVDVARRAGVSQTTVSLVFREASSKRVGEATRDRVLAAAREIGYQPNHSARSLRQRRTNLIGLATTVYTSYSLGLVAAARRAALAGGRQLVVLGAEDEDASLAALDLVARGTVDALILSPHGDRSMAEAVRTAALGRPVVLAGPRTDPRLPAVLLDLEAAGRIATEHLVSLGHRRIAFVTPPRTTTDGRRAGYRAVLGQHGLEAEDQVVVSEDHTARAGHRAVSDLLEHGAQPRPTALFTYNEELAIGAVAAARDHGLVVGTDLAVVGCNDSPISEFLSPPLTSIALPGQEAGRRAVELAMAQDDPAHGQVEHVVLAPQLNVRESSVGPLGSDSR